MRNKLKSISVLLSLFAVFCMALSHNLSAQDVHQDRSHAGVDLDVDSASYMSVADIARYTADAGYKCIKKTGESACWLVRVVIDKMGKDRVANLVGFLGQWALSEGIDALAPEVIGGLVGLITSTYIGDNYAAMGTAAASRFIVKKFFDEVLKDKITNKGKEMLENKVQNLLDEAGRPSI